MKTPAIRSCPALALLCLAATWTGGEHCAADPRPLNVTNSSPAEAQAAGSVRSITLPHYEPNLPPAPGRREFMMVCVSCHSPRYVTMQPPFSQHQWEETVAKMVKTYGAPADEKQARAIVDYLVVFNGPALNKTAGIPDVSDEESAAGSGGHLPPDTEPALELAIANKAQEHAADVKRGAALFMQDCAGCHGVEGRGDGIAGQVLLPRPANLTAAQFDIKLLSQVLWNGVPGTSMLSWRSLPRKDLNALAAYVQTLHSSANSDTATAETLVRGKTLFAQNCAVCHGTLGDGESAVAATLSPAPANLKWIQPDLGHVLEVLQDGIPGSAMPTWKDQLSESDRKATASFVRSLYESNKLNGK